MGYTVSLYDSKDGGRYFWVTYLYYTKKEVRQLAKQEYPECEIISIERS